MSLLCRFLGHAPASGHRLLDPFTFHELSRCRRCGVPLVRRHRGWKEMIVRPPAAGKADDRDRH